MVPEMTRRANHKPIRTTPHSLSRITLSVTPIERDIIAAVIRRRKGESNRPEVIREAIRGYFRDDGSRIWRDRFPDHEALKRIGAALGIEPPHDPSEVAEILEKFLHLIRRNAVS